jgi:periplasmic protein TonB
MGGIYGVNQTRFPGMIFRTGFSRFSALTILLCTGLACTTYRPTLVVLHETVGPCNSLAPPPELIPCSFSDSGTIQPTYQPERTDEVFTVAETWPEFPGGHAAMLRFIRRRLRLPRAVRDGLVSGRVFVSFVVGADGRISDVSVLKGVGFGCDEEATRVIRAMPAWKPGKQSGRAVRVRYNLPISFALE